MREILFRGKRIDNDEWVEGFYCQREEKIYGGTETRHMIVIPCPDSFSGARWIDVDPETVGMCVPDITDKNGEMIFEGDILQIYEGSEDDGYKIREVYSYRGVLCVDYETSEWDFNALAFLDSDNVFTFEVIGNIHDNPELLEVGE